MRESGVDLGTIGLFALVGTPYTLKFIWAPLVDALHIPFFTRALRPPPRLAGMCSQLLLIACDPAARTHRSRALAGLFVALARAAGCCHVIDTGHRGRCLSASKACPKVSRPPAWPSYVAAYRIGMLVSTAGVLFLVSAYRRSGGVSRASAWMWGLCNNGRCWYLIGTVTAMARDRAWSNPCSAEAATGAETAFERVMHAATGAFSEFLDTQGCACGRFGVRRAVQVHRRLFRQHDRAVRDRPRLFSRNDYAAIVKGVGPRRYADRRVCRWIRSTPLFAGRRVSGSAACCRRLPISPSAWLAVVGARPLGARLCDHRRKLHQRDRHPLFLSPISRRCARNPLHTATQYALLTALAAVGRTYLSSGAGYVAKATGWPLFFVPSVSLVALPSLILLHLAAAARTFCGAGIG